MFQKQAILFLLLVFCFSIVVSQNTGEQLIFQHINEKNGLSNNIVNSIIKDSKGYMWIATFDGLNRFDGTHFISFRNNRSQPNSLQQNSVHGICTDKKDDIWCATQSGISLFHQQTQTFELFLPDTIHSNASYSDIVCDAWGTIWCIGNFGLYEYLPATNNFKTYNSKGAVGQSLSADLITKRGLALSPDKKSLWLASIKGINHFDIVTKKIYNYKHNPNGLSLFDSLHHYPISIDKTGKLLFGNEYPSILIQYDLNTNIKTELDILFLKKTNNRTTPSYIFVDKNNRYWISTWSYSCIRYDPETKQTQEFYNDNYSPFSISGDFFWNAFEDEEGTLWFGTVNGLSYTNPDQTVYKLYQPLKKIEPGVISGFINHYFEDNKNNWWFNRNYRRTLYQYNPSSGELHAFNFSERNFEIQGITQLKDHLLVNTSTGITSCSILTGREEELTSITYLKKTVGTQSVYWLRLIGDSVICLLASKSGIIQYNLHTRIIKTISLNENDFLKQNINFNTTGIVSAQGNKLYLGFSSLKIASYDLLTNQLDTLPVPIDSRIKLLENALVNLKEDAAGNLWITLNGTGLIYLNLKTKETKLWQQSDGLVFNHVHESAFDDHQKLWIAAYNKFSIFDPLKNSFENFSLPINENNYAYNSRMVKLHNGNILGNMGQTFIEWLPEKIKKNTTDLPVLINRIIVNDSSVWLNNNDEIKLNHKQGNFSIEFGVVTGLEKSRYQLQYKLDGFDEKWKIADAQNTAVYTNVPEKKLIFRVRTISVDNSWQGKETTLAITVTPPFYRTSWFRILAALVFAGAIVLLIRLRINSIRKSEKQKNEFNQMLNEWQLKALRSQMNPHFIFNCMNSIDMYILKNDAENASRYLNKFAKLVRLILSQSNDMYVPLGKEIEMLKYYLELEALRFDYPFSYAINCSDELDLDETEIPSMLLQPYVENAILHGLRHKKATGNLNILVSRKDNSLFCIIEDDGIGRERSAEINATRTGKHESRGTILAEERLKVMEKDKGKPVINIIDLKDENGIASGTRVEITIPMDFDY
jgi:ligand-binding sensor domain-containing protein/anti-sigma regulatory factor (Ser/Thr protein kinase)